MKYSIDYYSSCEATRKRTMVYTEGKRLLTEIELAFIKKRLYYSRTAVSAINHITIRTASLLWNANLQNTKIQ